MNKDFPALLPVQREQEDAGTARRLPQLREKCPPISVNRAKKGLPF